MSLMIKIWATILVLMIPFSVLVDYSNYNWHNTIKSKTVEFVYALMGGSLIGLFFAIVLAGIWGW